jgi:hypothetical protein
MVLSRIQRVFRAGIGLEIVDFADGPAFLIIVQKSAGEHEPAATAAAQTLAVSAFISRLQIDDQLPDLMIKVVAHDDLSRLKDSGSLDWKCSQKSVRPKSRLAYCERFNQFVL